MYLPIFWLMRLGTVGFNWAMAEMAAPRCCDTTAKLCVAWMREASPMGLKPLKGLKLRDGGARAARALARSRSLYLVTLVPKCLSVRVLRFGW